MRITDAYPWSVNASQEQIREVAAKADKIVPTELRTNLKIYRRKGTAAGGALFEAEVVTGGLFFGEFTLRNYQLWQLTLLALVLRDFNEGHQRIGAAKSRGLGRVRVMVSEFEVQQWGVLASNGKELRGIGFLGEDIIKEYDLIKSDSMVAPTSIQLDKEHTQPGIVDILKPTGDADERWRQLAEVLVQSDNWKQLCGRRKKL